MRVARGRALAVALTLAMAPAWGAPGLYELVDQRLELMAGVAAHKWHHGLPVTDPEREAVVVEAAVADALRHGLTVPSSRRFFEAQIEAAKEIQRHWFRVWESGSPPDSAPDLAEVRAQLLTLGDRILAAAGGTVHSRTRFQQRVDVAGLSDDGKAALFAAAQDLEHYPHRLGQILATGVLRIGTTGDYAPFSHREDGERDYTGIDIDLGRDLAAGLGVTATFVPTSWPDLLDDLAAGRFDIAMSGVSRTLDRQRYGYLSAPYYVGGKTPVARCADADRFASLADIDQPGVRVIVNPGGTNERFVDEHIRRAEKVPHRDNRSIFDAILAGRADVMITDRVEVALQTARHSALCATMPGTLTYQEKGYLMPQDEAWRAFVELWLALAIADGTVATAFRRHQVAPNLP